MSPDTIPLPERAPEALALEGLLKWTREDYGEGFESLVIMDLMTLARAHLEVSLLDIIEIVALDWSK